jgi:hypothetical protein
MKSTTPQWFLLDEIEDKRDDIVHDAASQIATAVNNSGADAQYNFLREQGYADDDIRKAMD